MAPVSSSTLPAGQYKVVSIALDLTGKKLIDEICQIGAYCDTEKSFSQYIMPFRDISSSSIRSHGVRILTTFGKYRVLKEASTMKTLRTKSEFAGLSDFMQWLKEMKGGSDGIILAYHDNNRDTVTSFLLESCNRFKLADDFFNIVVGFINVEILAKEISEEPDSELKGKNLTLRALTKELLTNDQVKGNNKRALSMQSARNRADYTYMVLQKLTKSEGEVKASDQIMKLCANRVDALKTLAKQQVASEKILTLKPLFAGLMRKSTKDRSRAVILRRYLINAEIDYAMLLQAYENGSGSEESVSAVISKTTAVNREKDMEELVATIMSHFKHGGEEKKNEKGVEIGQGEPTITITTVVNESATSTSSTESDDDDFEEAHEDEVAEK